MSERIVNRLMVDAVRIVESVYPGYCFASDVAKALNCTLLEARMALMLAEDRHAPISHRKDGRWYKDSKKVGLGSATPEHRRMG